MVGIGVALIGCGGGGSSSNTPPGPPRIMTTSFPAAVEGVAYSQTIQVTGTAPLTYSVSSGALPAGLSLSASTGAITGTPMGPTGPSAFTIKVTDGNTPAQSATASLSITVNAPPTFTTMSLPTAMEGSAYSQTIQAAGTAPLAYSISSGALPTGLNLSTSTGAITGTPIGPTGPSAFTIKVTDGNTPAQSATQPLSITVNPAATLMITTPTLTNGNVNAAYSATLQSTGGVAPIAWSVIAGALPTGLNLNSSTGAITGTPTESGVFSLTFQAADSSLPQQTSTEALGLTIDGGTLAITTNSLLNPMVAENYNQTVQFTGGTAPVTWSLTSGTLPPGLSLNPSTGAIAGIPTTAAISSFTVQVSDSSAPTPQMATKPLSLTVTTATACGSGSESLLNGQYAMALSGFDGSGPIGMLASFTADGTGKITAGFEDINSNGSSGVQTNLVVTTLSSSYAIGSDRRGCLTLVAGGLTRVFRFSLGLIKAGVASSGRTIEFDTTGTNTTGSFGIQDPADFSNAAMSNSYHFTANSPLTTATGGGLFAAVGVLSLNGTTGTVTGLGDININGTMDPGNVGYPASPITFTPGTYNIASNGRGTLSFTLPVGQTINLIVYVAADQQLLMMSSDAQSATNTLFNGFAAPQTGAPYSNSSVNALSVLFASGQTATGAASASRVEAGIFTPDGNGNFTFSGDQNSGGTISTQTATGTYTVAPSGRVLVTNTGGTTPALVLYLGNAQYTFAISTDTHVMTGNTEPQLGGPFTNASLTGTYVFGTINPEVVANLLTAGVATYDGAGNVTGTFDINESGFLSLGNALMGTYAVSSNGRVVTPATGTTQRVTYIISTGSAVSFDYTSGDSNPTLVVIEQ
jgi:Putative Ig domain